MTEELYQQRIQDAIRSLKAGYKMELFEIAQIHLPHGIAFMEQLQTDSEKPGWPLQPQRIFENLKNIVALHHERKTLTLVEAEIQGAINIGLGYLLGQVFEVALSGGIIANASLLSPYALYLLLLNIYKANASIVLYVSPFPSHPITHQILTGRLPSCSRTFETAHFDFFTPPTAGLYYIQIHETADFLNYAHSTWTSKFIVLTSNQADADWLAEQHPQLKNTNLLIFKEDPAQPILEYVSEDEVGDITLMSVGAGMELFPIMGSNFKRYELEPCQFIPLDRFSYTGAEIIVFFKPQAVSNEEIAQLFGRTKKTLFIITSLNPPES